MPAATMHRKKLSHKNKLINRVKLRKQAQQPNCRTVLRAYRTATAHVSYEYDAGKDHVTITADRACLLHFPNAELEGNEYLYLEADEAQTFELPPEPCEIYYDVYVQSDTERYTSEPPIIRP